MVRRTAAAVVLMAVHGLLVLLLSSAAAGADAASSSVAHQCETCEDIYRNFVAGMQRTAKANFGGGNTDWEESRLGAFRFSETRLVDIQEKLCTGARHGSSACHGLAEAQEDAIEEWWFKVYKLAPDSAITLRQWLCVDRLKLCCPERRFGPTCAECTKCDGHGACRGNGTRSGDGACVCHKGYRGEQCDRCAADHFTAQERGAAAGDGGQALRCAACATACATCIGSSASECGECATGFRRSVEGGACEDVNECAESSRCAAHEYCLNTAGAFECRACHRACGPAGCTAPGDGACRLERGCAQGFEERQGRCQDVDECAAGVSAFGKPRCSAAHERCVNSVGSFSCECQPGFKRGGLGGRNQPCVSASLPPPRAKRGNDKQQERRKPPALIWTTSFAVEFGKLAAVLLALALGVTLLRGKTLPSTGLALATAYYVTYQSQVLDKTYMRFAPK